MLEYIWVYGLSHNFYAWVYGYSRQLPPELGNCCNHMLEIYDQESNSMIKSQQIRNKRGEKKIPQVFYFLASKEKSQFRITTNTYNMTFLLQHNNISQNANQLYFLLYSQATTICPTNKKAKATQSQPQQ